MICAGGFNSPLPHLAHNESQPGHYDSMARHETEYHRGVHNAGVTPVDKTIEADTSPRE